MTLTPIDKNYFEKAYESYKRGNHAKAISYIDKALEIDPSDSVALRNKGMILVNLGKYEQALSHINKALEIEPNNTELLLSKGLVLEILDKHNEATNYYGKALGVNPNPELLHRIGFSLFLIGKHEDAMNYFNKALEINPNDSNAILGKEWVSDMSFKGQVETSQKVNIENRKIIDELVKEIGTLQNVNMKNLIRQLSKRFFRGHK